jgi:hypothetical protein
MGSPLNVLKDAYQKLQTLTSEVGAAVVTGPTHYGPATVQSVKGISSPFGEVGPYTVVFQRVGDGDQLALVLQSVAALIKNNVATGIPLTFDYTKNVPVDTIVNVAVAAPAYGPALLVSISASGPPFKLSFLSLSGAPQLILNVQSVPSGMAAGVTQSYTFDYILASVSGQQYDLIVPGTLVITPLST